MCISLYAVRAARLPSEAADAVRLVPIPGSRRFWRLPWDNLRRVGIEICRSDLTLVNLSLVPGTVIRWIDVGL